MINFEEYGKHFNIIKVTPDKKCLIGYNNMGWMDHLKDTYYLAFPKLKDKKLDQLIIDLILKKNFYHVNVYDFFVINSKSEREYFNLTYNQSPIILLSSIVVDPKVDLNEYLNEYLNNFISDDMDIYLKFFDECPFLEENQKALEIFDYLKNNKLEYFGLNSKVFLKLDAWFISDSNILNVEEVEGIEDSKIKKINKKNFFIIN